MMMNNLRENSVGLFDTSNFDDPLQWKKLGVIKDPLWKGVYPNPFHMGFSHDSKKGYFVVLRPPPREWGNVLRDSLCLSVALHLTQHGAARGSWPHPRHSVAGPVLVSL